METYIFYQGFFLLSIFTSFYCVEIVDYVIYHTSNIIPKPLLLPNKQVIGFSGNPGKMTRLSEYGEILYDKDLAFNYSDHACIKVLPNFNDKYVIATYNEDTIKLQVFNENQTFKETLVKVNLVSYLIDITLLTDSNILMNYVSTQNNKKYINIEKYFYNEKFEFQKKNNTEIIETDNNYISCIEISENKNILCTYVSDSCKDYYILLHSTFEVINKNNQIIEKIEGCGYSKIMNINIPDDVNDKNNTFLYCTVKNPNSFKCLVGRLNMAVQIIIKYTNIIEDCEQNAKRTDLTSFSPGNFIIACQKSNQKGIRVAKVQIRNNEFIKAENLDYVIAENIFEFPFVSKFGEDFISVFYSRKINDDPNKFYNSVYQILAVPNCNDIQGNKVFVKKESTIKITDYITLGLGSTGLLKYRFESIPTEVTIELYDTIDSKYKFVKVGEEYAFKYLHLIAGPQANIYNISFVGINNNKVGKRCSICFEVQSCFEGCETCTIKGNKKDNQCEGCQEGFAVLINNENQCQNKSEILEGYFYDETIKKWNLCFERCLTCLFKGDNNNHQCLTCKKDYKQVENSLNCITFEEAPSNYYLDNNSTYKPCYESCSICFTGREEENHNCEKCALDFFFFENSKSCFKIEDGYYFEKEMLKKCDSNCKTCVNTSIDCHSCYENKYLQETICITTCESQYAIDKDSKKCINCKEFGKYKYQKETKCINLIPEGTYVMNYEYNIINYCHDSCLNCLEGPDEKSSKHNCQSCKNGKFSDPQNPSNCINQCDLSLFNWYINQETKEYTCTTDKTCNSASGKNYIAETSECKINCKPGYSYNFICYPKCPVNTFPDEITFKCQVSSSFCKFNKKKYEINTDSDEELLKSINILITQYIHDYEDSTNNINWLLINHTFKIRLFKLDQCNHDLCYDSIINSSSSIPNDFAYLNITECQKILQNEYELPLISDVLFVMLDIKSLNSNANILNYLAYSSLSGMKLDLEKCRGTENIIIYPLIVDQNILQLAKKMHNKGIDIFNSNDPFFNDFCEPFYTEDSKDVILLDRRNDFFKNVTLCESGCNYTHIDYVTNRIECTCDIKSHFLKNYSIESNVFTGFPSIDSSNIIVVKCYNLVFNFLYFKVNYGSWIQLFLLFAFIVFIILFQVKSYSEIVSKISKIFITEVMLNPKKPNKTDNLSKNPSEFLDNKSKNIQSFELNKESSVNELSDINFDKPKLSIRDNLSNSSHSLNADSTKSLKTKKNKIFSSSLDNLNYEDAIVKDKRSFSKLLWNMVKKTIYGLNLCFKLNLFEPFTFRILKFILNTSFLLALNALLYNDQMISDRYNSSNETIIKQFMNSLYVGLVCFIIQIFISYCLSFNKRFYLIANKKYKNKEEYIKNIKATLKRFKCGIWVFDFISLIFIGLFWYYVAAFCSVYQKTQIFYLINCVTSCLFIILFQILFVSIIAGFKILSLKYQCKIGFLICNCLI